VHGRRKLYAGILRLTPFILLALCKAYPRYQLKEKLFKHFFSAIPADKLIQTGKQYAKQILPDIIYREALSEIEWHQQNGNKIIIITASSAIWLKQWCIDNKVELIATEFELNNNFFTGKIKGSNCYGKQKQLIVQSIMKEGLFENSYGYGNTRSDKHFMKLLKNSYYKKFRY